ncbi:MAG: hypothetical protein VX278_17655 [Myxococcota bacterium]|nr:hypothetical protein [Myxococcota bacterium]
MNDKELCGAPTHEFLISQLASHKVAVESMVQGELPTDLSQLIDMYDELGQTTSIAEACLVAAFNALDPRVGAGSTALPDQYHDVKKQSFALLSHTGHQFSRLAGPFAQLVHGGGGWSNQPVDVNGNILYRNTFKKNYTLTPEQRAQEYQNRVRKYLGGGGSFDAIVLLDAENINTLVPWSHYDYVMLPNLETRVYPTSRRERRGKPKAGHSLLVGSNGNFDDRLVLSAGEMWILKDHADDIEAVVIASNSGHFKPDFRALAPACAGLEAIGIPRERIVMFGGPNNIQAVFREVAELHGVDGLKQRLPPDPVVLLEEWNA